jgi:hypothetical protein
MRTMLLFIFLFYYTGIIAAQDLCNDEAILQVKGSWKKDADANMAGGKNITAINNRIDNISELFKTAYPDPKGIEAKWHRCMGFRQISNSAASYGFESLYLAWYCNQHLKKMMPGDETGTWAYVLVNSLNSFFERELLRINDVPVYTLPKKNGEWKGYPLYDLGSWPGRNHCIILTNKDQLPWKPITQEQYLKAIRGRLVDERKKSSSGYAINEENIKKSISDNEKNQYLKKADKEKINESLKKQLETIQKQEVENVPKMNKSLDDKIAIIDDYVNKASPSTLQQPAIIGGKTAGDFNGTFSTEEMGGVALVTVNQDYFNNEFPAYAPQLMVLLWRWDKNAPAMDFKKQFENGFPVEKLKAMLDK